MPRTNRSILVAIVSLQCVATAAVDAAPSEKRGKPPAATATANPSAAHTALAAGDAQRVVDLLKRRTLGLDEAERKSLQGRASFLLGQHGIARRKLQSAIRSRPDHATDHYWLGRVYSASGAPALATAAFEKAHWLGLETADLRHHWASALSESGLVLGEISRKPWPAGQSPPPALGDFALGGLVVGHLPKRKRKVIVAPAHSAIYQVYRALRIEPDRGDSRLLAGELWAAAKQHAQAVRLFEQAEGKLRGDERARCQLAWANSALRLGDFNAYLRHSREAMEANGGVDSAALAACYDRAAQEAASRGELPRQVRYLLFAVELRGEIDRLVRLADALTQSNRAADAHHYLRTALQQSPSPSQRRAINLRLRSPASTTLARPN